MLGALDRANGDPELIQPRHDEMAVFMATAHAKFTGEIGCCMATSGGGTFHLEKAAQILNNGEKVAIVAILTTDAGSVANWWARHLKMRQGMAASLAGNLATMGPGTPYGISAKLAHPGRPGIALVAGKASSDTLSHVDHALLTLE